MIILARVPVLLAALVLAPVAPDPGSAESTHVVRNTTVQAAIEESRATNVLVPGAAADGADHLGGALSASLGLRPAEAARPTGRDRRSTALWAWPLTGTPPVVKGFDPPEQRWLPGHRGIDLGGVAGEPVLAVAPGVVRHSGEIAGVGIVSITHADGLLSTYQPVSERIARGSRVVRGEVIGTLDPGGHCLLADCLHLGARRGRDVYVDPTPLLFPLELTLVSPTG